MGTGEALQTVLASADGLTPELARQHATAAALIEEIGPGGVGLPAPQFEVIRAILLEHSPCL